MRGATGAASRHADQGHPWPSYPAGMRHNFVNRGSVDLRLYTIYAPPEHAPGTVHLTRADADADEADHYDG